MTNHTAYLSRRGVLSGLAAAGSVAAVRPRGAQAAPASELARLPSLKEDGKRSGIPFGLSEATWQFPANRGYYEQLAKECNIYAPGNEFNWANIEQKRGVRVYSKLDAVTNFMKDRGVGMIGHTLLWYYAVPKWLVQVEDVATIGSLMDEYVAATVERFGDSIVRWDVINEPIGVPDKDDGLRQSFFIEKLGPGYFKRAFATAKAANPRVSLCVNEFGFEYTKPDNVAKRAALLKWLRKFRDDKVEVDCLGLQSHLDAGLQLDLDGMSKFLREVKALGYKVAVTELDVIDTSLDGDIEIRDRFIANHVKDYLSCVTAEVKPTTITSWGFTDGRTWLTMWHKRKDGRAMRPLPFDDQFSRKEQWAVIRQFLQ